MPGFDGTGPLGQGPMTGRGRGYCVVPLNDTIADPTNRAPKKYWPELLRYPYRTFPFVRFYPLFSLRKFYPLYMWKNFLGFALWGRPFFFGGVGRRRGRWLCGRRWMWW
ncbi:DUF5320 domain-containing protein [Caldicoprobacter algeriensis]|uniref:DUF5320 domain-containing protein n=1 Tax=Caldicoprobacter algeriensis TaxID=699281 RepID=UPI002079FAFE|nr:DUF5320 domain-containing protein [Caldicoprobacter algeriensis]MCM8900248.1 DUF5320 domain-containing protein [Caldicoprobacter algeriensis]